MYLLQNEIDVHMNAPKIGIIYMILIWAILQNEYCLFYSFALEGSHFYKTLYCFILSFKHIQRIPPPHTIFFKYV